MKLNTSDGNALLVLSAQFNRLPISWLRIYSMLISFTKGINECVKLSDFLLLSAAFSQIFYQSFDIFARCLLNPIEIFATQPIGIFRVADWSIPVSWCNAMIYWLVGMRTGTMTISCIFWRHLLYFCSLFDISNHNPLHTHIFINVSSVTIFCIFYINMFIYENVQIIENVSMNDGPPT